MNFDLIARPKEPRLECPDLLRLAEMAPCMLRVPGVCINDPRSVCACHANLLAMNKGGAMKSHDFFSVWGCTRCHGWLDSSYSASGWERERAFMRGLRVQIAAWGLIATDWLARPWRVDAACWALDHLIERGYARSDPDMYAMPVDAMFVEYL